MIRRAKPFLLGTLVDICVFDEVPHAQEAIDAAFRKIKSIHDCMSFHCETSDLNKINNCRLGGTLEVSGDLVKVLRICLDLNSRSYGVFNPAVAPILQNLEKLPVQTTKVPAHFSALSEAFEIRSSRQVLVKKLVSIDLGGIAKGYAVDEACRTLQEFGIENALVNAGGDLKAIGKITQNINIRHPQGDASAGITLSIRDQALATSTSGTSLGAYNSLSAHVDGRNGSVYDGQESISVLAKDCILADALCKVAFFLSDDRLESLLEHYDAELFVTSAEKLKQIPAGCLPENEERNATR